MNLIHRIQQLVPILALMGCSNMAIAQEGNFMARYQIGIPTSETKEYVDKTSWGGVVLGYRWLMDEDVAIGFDLGWQTFNQRNEYDTYVVGTASLSGIQYRYQNMFQMSAQAEYVFNQGGDVRPYVGVGAGGMYVRRLTSFGLFEVEQDPWQFMVKPAVGVSYYLHDGTALLIGTEFVAGFQDQSLAGQSYVAVNIGFLFGN